MKPSRRWDLLVVLALPVLVSWAYAPGIHAPDAYDDFWALKLNRRVLDLGHLARTALDPSDPGVAGYPLAWYPYRPLGEASFGIVRELGGATLAAQRAVNVAIHVVGAVLVFLLVRRLWGEMPSVARWAALLFALHPMAVHAVTYVYQRFVCLEFLLGLACVLAYARGRSGSRGAGWNLAALGLGALAAGCKETAATIPVALAAIEWVQRRPGEPLRAVLGRWAPFLALPVFVFVQVSRAVAAQKAVPGGIWEDPLNFGRWEYLGVQLPMWLKYARLHLWSFPLGFYYDRFAWGVGSSRVVPLAPAALAGLAILAGTAWILLGPRRHAAGRLGAALWMAPLLLESTVFPIQHVGWNFRSHASLLGSGILFGWAVSRAGRLGAFLGAGALLLMACMTRHENRLWLVHEDLLRRDVRHSFHDPLTRKCLGCAYLEQGRPDVAVKVLAQSMRSSWHSAPMRTAYVCALLDLGRYDEAHAHIRRGLEDFPGDPDLVWVAAREAVRVGEEGRIERYARMAEGLSVPGPRLAIWLSARLEAAGEKARAEAVLLRSLSYHPDPALREALRRLRPGEGP